MQCKRAQPSTPASCPTLQPSEMAFRLVLVAICVVAVQAGLLPTSQLAYSSPIASPVLAKVATPVIAKTVLPEEYDPHPQYNFGYDIQDALSGDIKEQHEQRDGDYVTGRYALNDPDGYRRIVEYTSDPIHGFNALVRREPLVAKVAAPIIAKTVPAPIAYTAPAPLTYSAPIAKLAPAPLTYTAPITRLAPAPLAYTAPALTKLAGPAQLAYATPELQYH